MGDGRGRQDQPRRVVIADDEEQLRDVLVMALATRPGVEVAAVGASGEEAVLSVEEHRPDVVVLDLAMPGQGGLWAAERILRDHPSTRVVILSAHVGRAARRELLALGVAAVLRKGGPVHELYAAVEGQ